MLYIKYCCLVLLLILNSCQFGNIESGSNRGYSKSIAESKKNNVFISNYTTPNMKIFIPKEGINIIIKEIFREYKFEIGENNEIIPLSESQLIMIVQDSVPNSYSIKWKIGDYNNIYFTSGKNYFDADLSKAIKFDTLCFEISKDRYSDNENEKIGELIILEK